MTGADVVEILGWLDAASADAWLDGGWGVDALVGEQTREHEDLDLIVRNAHVSRMREVLATHGFAQVEGVPQSFILADERGREVDVHPVRFDDQGGGHLLGADGEPSGHSSEAFAATGRVSGYRVACLSAEAQMLNHSWGYTPGETDFHDMRLLHDRLGTSLLGPYRCSERLEKHYGKSVAPLVLSCSLEVGHDGPHKAESGHVWDSRGLWQWGSGTEPHPPPSRLHEAFMSTIAIVFGTLFVVALIAAAWWYVTNDSRQKDKCIAAGGRVEESLDSDAPVGWTCEFGPP